MADQSKAVFDLSKLDLNAGSTRRKSVTSTAGSAKFQEKRRKEALSKQQEAREDRAQHARRLALQRNERQTSQAGGSPREAAGDGAADASAEEDLDIGKQLMQPEWMIEVPDDLQEEWYVMPRPEGQRCLVVAAQGYTLSRLRNGRVLHRWPSSLPSGSRSTLSGNDLYCILDCIFHEANATYYIMDVMCWKGYSLYDCTSEFRLFWRDTKLREEEGAMARAEARGEVDSRYSFRPVPAYPCTPGGLTAAHSGKVPFQSDGCYFLHKEAHYDTEGQTPLALLWKDPACTRFYLDTDANGVVPRYQHVILQYCEGVGVCTADDPPVALGPLPPEVASKTNAAIRSGKLLRFTIREGGLQLKDGLPIAVDLYFEGIGNQRRGRADTYSKIVFQHLARTQPILLSHFSGGSDPGDSSMAE